jgi:hypothetical protein
LFPLADAGLHPIKGKTRLKEIFFALTPSVFDDDHRRRVFLFKL